MKEVYKVLGSLPAKVLLFSTEQLCGIDHMYLQRSLRRTSRFKASPCEPLKWQLGALQHLEPSRIRTVKIQKQWHSLVGSCREVTNCTF